MATTPDYDKGFRRVLYDAMILTASLRILRDCVGYPKPKAAQINGEVEAHHMNALIQIRSLNDFLTDVSHGRRDTMIISHFPGCSPQPNRLPTRPGPHHRSAHTFVAHKSWDAVAKDRSVGSGQLHKRALVRIGLHLLDGFDRFWADCRKIGIGIRLNVYAKAYKRVYEDNVAYLRQLGP
ncbi:MAG: hypothetical protein ACYTG0_16485 [Planctomycetota bacterium]|jgi:hypothetical protein